MTQVNAAGVLLSEMAPQASLLPLTGELPPPQESQTLPLLDASLASTVFLGLSQRLWTPPCSAGAGIALSHLLNGGGCFSFLTLKAEPCETPNASSAAC